MGCSALKQLIPRVETSSSAISPFSGRVPGGAISKGNVEFDAGRGSRDVSFLEIGAILNENRAVLEWKDI